MCVLILQLVRPTIGALYLVLIMRLKRSSTFTQGRLVAPATPLSAHDPASDGEVV
jgi:hypothetical protein